ncbi:MAG: OmpH family outer membrane protein [Candidatus Babeliales bacterium]
MNNRYFNSLLMLLIINIMSVLYINAETAAQGIKKEDTIQMTKDEIQTIVREEMEKSFAYFDPFKILERSLEYKDEVRKIEKELDSRKQQLKSLEETAMKRKTELETMANALSESAKERKKEEMGNLEAQYRIKAQGAQEYAENAEQKARMKVLRTIQIEAEALAKEEGRMVVLAGGVVYGVKPIDLTEKILERINTKYRASKEKNKNEGMKKPAVTPAA